MAGIEAEGGSASGHLLNAVEEGSIEQLVTHIEASIGPIAVAVFNLGAQIGDRGLASTSLKQFETGWRMATFGLFRLAQVLFPYMEKRGKGVLLVTSATACHESAYTGQGGVGVIRPVEPVGGDGRSRHIPAIAESA